MPLNSKNRTITQRINREGGCDSKKSRTKLAVISFVFISTPLEVGGII